MENHYQLAYHQCFSGLCKISTSYPNNSPTGSLAFKKLLVLKQIQEQIQETVLLVVICFIYHVYKVCDLHKTRIYVTALGRVTWSGVRLRLGICIQTWPHHLLVPHLDIFVIQHSFQASRCIRSSFSSEAFVRARGIYSEPLQYILTLYQSRRIKNPTIHRTACILYLLHRIEVSQ